MPPVHSYSSAVDLILYIGLGYMIGSIPFGYLAGTANGVDIREKGSGNIGTTNTIRILGWKIGSLVFIADTAKGAIPVLLLETLDTSSGNLPFAIGIAAILGHNYSCFLRFKGGKGIATTAGVLIVWAPVALGIALATWLIALGLTRIVAVASVSAATILPLAMWVAKPSPTAIGIAIFIAIMAAHRHRLNFIHQSVEEPVWK